MAPAPDEHADCKTPGPRRNNQIRPVRPVSSLHSDRYLPLARIPSVLGSFDKIQLRKLGTPRGDVSTRRAMNEGRRSDRRAAGMRQHYAGSAG